MFALRLFHASDPTRQIETRTLDSGELVVGREPGTGWRITDPDKAISRRHCVLSVKGGQLSVRDVSANGIFLGERRQPAPKEQAVPIQSGDIIRLGQFTIMVERATAPAGRPSLDGDPFDAPSPFASPVGRDPVPPRSPDPFASELPRDPLSLDALGSPAGAFGGRETLPTLAEDAWERREAPRAGEWNAPSRLKPDGHEQLIGSDRAWAIPPARPTEEAGLAFDAPFVRPILKSVEVRREDLAIPDDWDAPGPAEPSPAPPPRAPLRPAPAAADPFAGPPVPTETLAEPPRSSDPFAEPPPARAARAAEPAPVESAPPVEPPTPLSTRAAAQAVGGALPAEKSAPAGDLALLQAFCAGAHLDPKAFADEDAEALMRKLGTVYRQMVLGLGDLLQERTTVKNEYRMVRTTVRAEGNNPFKWAPPARVAVDLLSSKDDGFLSGAAAVTDSFQDLKKHVLCLLAGMRAAVSATLDALEPGAIERQAKAPSAFGLKSRPAISWAEFVKVYAEFKKEADDNPDSQINREFRDAYERQLQALDGLNPPK